jgi:hypothetical protein
MWIQERPTNVDRLLPAGLTPDINRLRSWTEALAIPRHMSANARGNKWVREQIVAAFHDSGFTVRLQGPYRNVVALPACASRERITLVAAHYDSVPDCPGADDNASGLAVMLECARLLEQVETRKVIGFVAFNAEEDELLGSRDFVAQGLSALPSSVALAHVLEMVGFRGNMPGFQQLPLPWLSRRFRQPDFLGLLGKGHSNKTVDRVLNSSSALQLRLLAAKTWGPLHRLFPDLRRSDHFSFWNSGIPAVLWTDTANFRNPNYHCPSDTPDTLDYTFMSDVTELLCDTLLK